MAKDFSIQAKILLDAAGFSTGKEKVSKDAKTLEKGITQSNTAIKDSFGELTNAALPEFASQFGGLGKVFGGTKTALKALIPAIGSVRTAIISTGIGAIIIAISLAIAGLIGWMKRTDEGGDTMRKVFDVIKAVIQVVLEKITSLGSAIVKLFKGDFKGAAQDAKNAFSGWGQAMKDNIAVANKLNEVQDKLEDYNVEFATKRATLEEKISELQLKARDEETYTAKQRLAFNDQLKKAKLDLFNLEYGQKKLEYDAAKQEYEMGAKNQDTRQKLNEKEAELIKIRSGYNQELRETVKLNNKLQDEVKKQLEAEQLAATKLANTAPEKAKTAGIKIPNLAPAINAQLATMKPYMDTATDLWKKYEKGALNAFQMIKQQGKLAFKDISTQAVDLGNIISGGIISSVYALTDAFGNLFSGAASGFKDVVTVALQTIQQIINALLAQAIAGMIAGESKKGIVGLVTAAIGVSALLAVWQSKVPKFATGGVMPHTGYALVGEQGPELLPLQKGQRIYNNMQTQNILSNAGGRVDFEIKGNRLVGVQKNYLRGLYSHK